MDNKDHDCLVRIDERMKAVCEKIDKILTALEKQNGRIRSLEKWKFALLGIVVFVSCIVGAIRIW